MELEAQIRCHVAIGHLFVREHDVESDRFPPLVRGAAVGGLHDRWSTARADDEMLLAFGIAATATGQARQLSGDFIIAGLGLEALGDLLLLFVARSCDQSIGHVGRGNSSRAIENERRSDVRFIEQQFRFQKLQLKSDRAQILSQEELAILKGELVGRAFGLGYGRYVLSGACINLGSRENAFWG